MSENDDVSGLVELAGEIVAAYVVKNAVRPSELPDLIRSVHAALTGLGQPAEPEPVEHIPAVPVRRSVQPDHLLSLIDGKPYKSLKRHLARHGLTPDEYRQRYGLPASYPMVAPSYAKMRSELAKSMGFGEQRRTRTREVSEPDPSSEAAE